MMDALQRYTAEIRRREAELDALEREYNTTLDWEQKRRLMNQMHSKRATLNALYATNPDVFAALNPERE